MEEKEVKKDSPSLPKIVQKWNLYLAIFNYIKRGKSPSDMVKDFKLTKQKVNYYTNNLKKWGFIAKKGKKAWFTIVQEFSLGTRPKSNLHALQINIPILSGHISGTNWTIKEELKNWTPKYRTFDQLGGITIKNNNNKSITLFAHSRDIKDLKEIDKLSYDLRNWSLQTFLREFGVVLDIINAQVKSLHIATENQELEGLHKEGETFKLDLGKKAEKVFPKDNMNAEAWLDGSPYLHTVETNDKDWKRAYLEMPFSIRDLSNSLYYIAQNYASHVAMVEKGTKTFDKLDKVLEKLDKRLSQTKLTEFL